MDECHEFERDGWGVGGGVYGDSPFVCIEERGIEGMSDEEIGVLVRKGIRAGRIERVEHYAEVICEFAVKHPSRTEKRQEELRAYVEKYCPELRDFTDASKLAAKAASTIDEYLSSPASQRKPKSAHVERERKVISGKIEKILYCIGKRDGFLCAKCSTSMNLQIDHIIPVTAGGTSEMGNLQLLCQRCNLKKSTRTIDYRQEVYKDLPLFGDSK